MEMRGGSTAREMNARFNELLDAVYLQRKGGSIKIVVKVNPSGLSGDGLLSVTQVELIPSVVIGKPEPKLDKGVFYVGRDGSLTRLDPQQQEMFELQEELRNV